LQAVDAEPAQQLAGRGGRLAELGAGDDLLPEQYPGARGETFAIGEQSRP
jgi:hypothetical protein